MSEFDDLFAEVAAPLLLEELASDVTYNPPGDGTPVAIKGIVGFEETEEDPATDGRRQRRVRDVTITTDPDDAEFGGVAEPSTRATVTIGSVEYAVESIIARSGIFARLGLIRIGSIEKSRPGYRQ